MKFRCERDVLDRAFSTAGRAISNRGSAPPVMSGLHLHLVGDNLAVVGSDLDLTIRVDSKVGGQEDGVVVLPAKLAADIVRSFDSGQVTMTVDDDGARVVAGRSDFNLRVMSADEFPRFEEPDGDAVTLDAESVSAALEQVVKAASGDDSRPILTGVLLAAEDDGLRFVATDSYRLAVRDLPGTSVLGRDQTVLVPSRALEVTGRLLGDAEELTIRLADREASFVVDDVTIVTRLIEGEFPNYRGLIPSDHPNTLVVGRVALIDAVRRVGLLARDATPVRLSMSSEGLELIAITQDVGQAHETLDSTYEGKDKELTVAFNPGYLLDGLEVSPGDEVRLETIDALKPAVIRSVDVEGFLYLLMPVRVS
ncbi:MAG: DNA polymerase III subunit beta [Acidimicrobiaceae bacterium]|nr:DNA polymerase III subunit beta [Acidimicrobiaceae bacterium]MDP6481892.1 DNA polymerase III subunit beta [Acidimicrobiales bacterium]MDP6697708.1 DNA polymerase III subunit beta [Acidimicrobiales bacterium]